LTLITATPSAQFKKIYIVRFRDKSGTPFWQVTMAFIIFQGYFTEQNKNISIVKLTCH